MSIRRFITTRHGGHSRTPYDSFNLGAHVGDDPAAVAANRARLAAELGVSPQRLVWMDQVHGTRVARVTGPPGGPLPATDAVVTTEANMALAVLTADCVPVLAGDDTAGVIGAAHAGRVGAAAGIARTLIEAMVSLGARPERITVLLGPAASGDFYELPADMADATERALPGSRCTTAAGTPGVDLRAGLRHQLATLGVKQVDIDPRCTIADEDLFSYRRSGTTGRLASLIVREEQ